MPPTTTGPRLRVGAHVAQHAWLMQACVLLMLAGLVGMHGLSDHGLPTTHDHTMQGDVAAPAAAMAHPFEQALAVNPSDSPMAAPHAKDHPGGMGHMGGPCLAFLTGLLVGLAAWLAAKRPSRLSEKRVRHLLLPRPRGRDPDPPSLDLLSVLRC